MVRRPFRSSFISIINSLEWFSELQYLKNILEINAGHFEAKKVRISSTYLLKTMQI